MIKRKETTAELVARLVLAYWKRKEQEQSQQQVPLERLIEANKAA